MRKSVLLACAVLFVHYGSLLAQNKTLGVGATTPNANAALHVESPTGNQGLLMPRLTTLQREAMIPVLTAADKGLMLFDTDKNIQFTWDGAGWKSSFEYQMNDATDTSSVVNVLNLGLGSAGKFRNENTGSKKPTVWAETKSDSGFSRPLYALNSGTGDAAAFFEIKNTGNRFAAAFAQTNGSGPAVFASQIGTGRGGQFQITNNLNTDAALRSYTSGTGYAGFFTVNNTASSTPAIFTTTNGSGAAIMAENNGAADGFAGLFSVRQSTNTYPAVQASTVGPGSGVRVIQNVGTGPGMDVYMQNTTSTAPGFSSDHAGLGNAGSFTINNITSKAAAIYAMTNGAGPAINATHTGSGDAVYVERQGATGGSAGNFRISNMENPASSVYASTNAPAGFAVGMNHEANGVALAIWGGGMKVSTSTLSAGTLITTRASAYFISGGGPDFTFDTTIQLNEGEIFYFFNSMATQITVNRFVILSNEAKTFIFLGGALRAL